MIGLGEATHGTHEMLAFKAALTKALVTANRVNAVAFAINFHAGRNLDAYVAGGPGTAAEVLAASGVPAPWRTAEVVDLLDWLRAWNAAGSTRIHVVGVDVQDVLGDTQAALALLAAVEPEAGGALHDVWAAELTRDKLKKPFRDVVREWTREQWETLYVAAQVLEDLLARPTTRLSQSPGFVDARHAARAARLGLAAFEFDVGGTPTHLLPTDAYTRRDIALGDNLLAIVGPPARAVFWAHDSQISRGAYRASDAYNTGDYLHERLGSAYHTVGFAWRRGAFHVNASTDSHANRTTAVTLSDRSLGGLFKRAGQTRAWCDLTALPKAGWATRLRNQPLERGWFGGPGSERAPPTALANGVDVLVFFDTVSPSQQLPATR